MITIGSRGSALALTQTAWIKERILHFFPKTEVSIKIIKTSADKDTTTSLRGASTIGLFVKELEQALLDEEIDLAVHSMKDVPTQIPAGLQIAAVPEREDARDAFISDRWKSFFDLPEGSRIGTGSIRRQAQILAVRPDLKILDIRGNVDSRLKKLENGQYDAVILACAGLRRLGLQNRITEPLDFATMLPAPGQGALAVEIRAGDSKTQPVAAALNHEPSAVAVSAERAFLQRMGGGCNVPVAAHAFLNDDMIEIDGLVASADGRKIIRHCVKNTLPMADEAVNSLSDRVLTQGGRAILETMQRHEANPNL
jgi:hydroxymethylbilane synthase